jgi:indole-3-glycerol phosphate synthase
MQASLDTILAATRQRVSLTRRSADLDGLERAAAQHSPRGFRRQLHQLSQSGIAIIAELKKASPSKGLIRADFRPAALATQLEQAGAAALSVLTDEEFFQGSLANLKQASAITAIPCLRKDFIVDEFQILEARANGADAILLIVAALEQSNLTSLAQTARNHALDVLCEAHDEEELERALDAGCDLIGINSRNLRTFEVDLSTPFRIANKMPARCLRVAESGIRSGTDIGKLRAVGYDAFLIGESLMRAADPGSALAKLLEEAKVCSSELEARSS